MSGCDRNTSRQMEALLLQSNERVQELERAVAKLEGQVSQLPTVMQVAWLILGAFTALYLLFR